MKYDPALKRAVQQHAQDGAQYNDAEVTAALTWAFDTRAADGAPTRLDGWYKNTALGDAALAAVTEYKPPQPKPPTTAQQIVICAGAGAAGLTVTLLTILAVQLTIRVLGGHLHVPLSAWALLAGWAVWFAVAWLARKPLGLARPLPTAYTRPLPATQRHATSDGQPPGKG